MADENRITDIPGDSTHQGTGDADTFVFGPGYTNADTITGFTNGDDRIDLTRFAGITRFEDLTVTSDDGGVTIDLTAHGGGTIRLAGFSIDNLGATDFVFSRLDGGGTTGDDDLQADADGDRLDGGDGDDVLTGGAGADMLLGGAGDDRLYGGAGNDVLEAGAGDDFLYGGSGNDDVWGGAGDDTLHGGAGDDWLDGGAGDDAFVFAPGNGNDVITDFINGQDRIDLSAFTGVTSFDDLTVTAGNDGVTIDLSEHDGGTILLLGLSLDDLDAEHFTFAEAPDPVAEVPDESVGWRYGTGGNDRILGDANDDRIDGLGGHDTIFGGAGDDSLKGGEGDDSILADGGDDTVYGGAGNDWIVGGAGNDTLYGDGGNDRLIGSTGDDDLYGGAGQDAVNGGLGDDDLYGGADADTFVFNGSFGTDTVHDFTDGEELIDLSTMAGISGFDDLSITADGSAAVIDLTGQGGGTIRLENVDTADLGAEDFLFYEPPVDPEVDGG